MNTPAVAPPQRKRLSTLLIVVGGAGIVLAVLLGLAVFGGLADRTGYSRSSKLGDITVISCQPDSIGYSIRNRTTGTRHYEIKFEASDSAGRRVAATSDRLDVAAGETIQRTIPIYPADPPAMCRVSKVD